MSNVEGGGRGWDRGAAGDHMRVLGNGDCLLCGEAVAEGAALAHLTARHPNRFDVFETVPEGAIVVVHTDS